MVPVRTTKAVVRFAGVLPAVAVVVALGIAGCGGSSPSPGRAALGPDDVEVANFAFTPATLTVKAGTTVTWHFDQPSAPHNVVSLSTPALFNSGTPKGRGTYSFTFTTPGTYPYLCQVHTTMRGTIVVTP
jgi:plastocyanin